MRDVKDQATASSSKRTLTVGPGENGKRTDIAAALLYGSTRSHIQSLIEKGLLTVNSVQVKPNHRVLNGDLIELEEPEAAGRLIPEDLGIPVLYQDKFLIVLDKPAGVVIYPAAGHDRGTLMNAVAYLSAKLATVGAPLRPGVVHRLDKDTSGVMVVALDDPSYYSLIEKFRSRTIRRVYTALVYGSLQSDEGEISLLIGRSATDRKKMSTRVKKGKHAVTTWKVIERYSAATLISAKLGTGRTHQIRVHFASIGHPVLGDRTYGRKTVIQDGKMRIEFPRQMLHASVLGFVHPGTGQQMEFSSPLPADMVEAVTALKYPL